MLALHYIDDLSLDETAAVLDLSIGTVKSRLAYGLATLRRVLAEMHSHFTLQYSPHAGFA